jgi:hypothetical protein
MQVSFEEEDARFLYIDVAIKVSWCGSFIKDNILNYGYFSKKLKLPESQVINHKMRTISRIIVSVKTGYNVKKYHFDGVNWSHGMQLKPVKVSFDEYDRVLVLYGNRFPTLDKTKKSCVLM